MLKNAQFEALNLSDELSRAVADLGYKEASPIQKEAIPYLLEGRDIVGQAMTGSGKTAAFGIPIAEKINIQEQTTQALVLCPTRELAIQVCRELEKLLKYKQKALVLPVYGGQPIERQIKALHRGVHIVVGTPGRLIDHLDRGTLDLKHVKMVVLDEADQMLDMGFRDDIEVILQHTNQTRQSVLFSATMSPEILTIAKRYQKNPHIIKIAQDKTAIPVIDQMYFDIDQRMKLELLSRLIDLNSPQSSIVFCNTKRKVDDIVSGLISRGYAADGIHGNISQPRRNRVMEKFRKGAIDILVATDVAARGIDVPHVEAVFNFEIPKDNESYVHRIGRTGRAGKKGKAFSFVSGNEQYGFRSIMRYTKTSIAKQPLPLLDHIEAANNQKLLNELKKILQAGSIEKHIQTIKEFTQDGNHEIEIAAALLKLISSKKNIPQNQQEDLLLQAQPKNDLREDRGFSRRRYRDHRKQSKTKTYRQRRK